MAKLKALTDQMIAGVCETGKSVKLGHNTWLVKTEKGHGIKYHETVVVDFVSSYLIRLDSNGWRTPTTKQRINEYIPHDVGVYQTKGIWRLSYGNRDVEFRDGLCLVIDSGWVSKDRIMSDGETWYEILVPGTHIF